MDREYPKHPLVGVGALVWREDRVLLVRRNRPPKQGEWSLPGGMLEVGETLQQGVAREVMEETACAVAVGEIVATIDLITRDEERRVQYHYVLIDLLAEWITGEGRPNDESSDLAWTTLADLAQYNLWSETERVIRLSAEKRTERGA